MRADGKASARISPTAHYTGYVWVRAGLSHRALATWQGRALYWGAEPLVRLMAPTVGGTTLETLLRARHAILDSLLHDAISRGEVGQVVEIAAGMSARGLRFVMRHPQLRYVEADLPAMAGRKRGALSSAGLLDHRHRVVDVDALADEGPLSLRESVAPLLDPSVGTAVVTEGLVNYFDEPTTRALWARIARLLAPFPHGLYLSDLHLSGDVDHLPAVRLFRHALGVFARGATHLHYESADQALSALASAGLDAALHRPSDWVGRLALPPASAADVVRVVEARPH